MISYNSEKDCFEGSDDDIDDDSDDIMTIEDLVDDEEVDDDSEEPTPDAFAEAFIGI